MLRESIQEAKETKWVVYNKDVFGNERKLIITKDNNPFLSVNGIAYNLAALDRDSYKKGTREAERTVRKAIEKVAKKENNAKEFARELGKELGLKFEVK